MASVDSTGGTWAGLIEELQKRIAVRDKALRQTVGCTACVHQRKRITDSPCSECSALSVMWQFDEGRFSDA